jgi:hypothetical protein
MSDVNYTTPRVLHMGAFAEMRDAYERLAGAVTACVPRPGFPPYLVGQFCWRQGCAT